MMAIIGIVAFLVLVGLFFLFRGTGRLGQGVSVRERNRHNSASSVNVQEHEEHRATGLN
ncbi:hypothetical protein [Paracidobacterium acidisoli]|uniref:hypothetical protein n=1 Tax=Paracidobacterium acidisoli TaxID=2303751 RepID=UPI001314A7A4|nr:hypothetical protein [Paracidobacterium acidisoli]MBT9330537.1 hypothetical protein [Paracidobacterium acidisoli]